MNLFGLRPAPNRGWIGGERPERQRRARALGGVGEFARRDFAETSQRFPRKTTFLRSLRSLDFARDFAAFS
jgi:hypothetical protein